MNRKVKLASIISYKQLPLTKMNYKTSFVLSLMGIILYIIVFDGKKNKFDKGVNIKYYAHTVTYII